MAARHARTEPAGEHAHIDEAHDRTAVDRAAHITVLLGREHTADSAARSVRLEQQAPGRAREAAVREVAPAQPAWMIGIGLGADRLADVLHHLGIASLV